MLGTYYSLFKPVSYIIYVWISVPMTAEKALIMTSGFGDQQDLY